MGTRITRFLSKYGHLLLGTGIFIYLLLRIFITPISDDEYLTFREHVPCDIKTIITSGKPDVYWAPNNHILNTLLIKLSLSIFGLHDWAFRLHILVAFVVCYCFVYKILLRHIESTTRIVVYLSILFMNAYLLDFFSIARGYAISMAGWAMSSYYFSKYYKGDTAGRNLWFTLAGLFIAVWSNFSTLYFIPIFGLLFLIVQVKNKSTGIQWKQLILFPVGLLAIVAVIVVPLKNALAAGTLVWGTGNFFQDSFVASVDYYMHYNYLMGRFDRISEHWSRMELYAALLIIFWVLMQIISWTMGPLPNQRKIHIWMLFQVIGLLATVVLLHLFFGTSYPYHRTALIFTFPVLIALFFALETTALRQKAVNYLIYAISIFCLWHFSRSANLENTMEWYRNGDAKRVFSYLEKEIEQRKPGRKMVLGAEQWQYFTMAFYTETKYKDILTLEFTKLEKPEKFDYLYVPENLAPTLGPEYKLMNKFKHGSLFEYALE